MTTNPDVLRLAQLEDELFQFLTRKYVQRSDARQRAMGLIYTTAETHDLSKEVARFIHLRQPEKGSTDE